MTFPVNLTLPCYYFETFVIVTFCKEPQAMLCKQLGRQCDTVLNLTFTCYGEQSAILNLGQYGGYGR